MQENEIEHVERIDRRDALDQRRLAVAVERLQCEPAGIDLAAFGDEAFPGHQNFNNQLTKFMGEGGKVYACRFALQALYGHGEPSLIPGIRPINPLDVLDLILLHRKDDAFMIHTWTV